MGPGNAEERSQSYVGQLVAGRYRLNLLLGRGNMSAVYRAADPEGEPVAIKILYPELLDGEAGQRVERDSKLVLGLSHPHLVAALAAGRDEALGQYLVMPLLTGRNLDTVLKKERAIEPQVAARLVMQGANGVAAAHARGLVHR
ncbi:MAG: protein kinase, partial [Polyangiaceae bacterium]